MKLLRLSFHDHAQGWGFDDLRFFPDVTLLVGASGVGKTRVLNSIRKLREIARDRSFFMGRNSWSVDFLDDHGQKYTWEGEFRPHQSETVLLGGGLDPSEDQKSDYFSQLGEAAKPDFLKESLTSNGQTIFSRDAESFQVNGKQLEVKLSRRKSGFAILGEEPTLLPAKQALERIVVSDDIEEDIGRRSPKFRMPDTLFQKLKDIESIRDADLPTIVKLIVASETAKSTFDQIIQSFQDIFPTIEKVWIDDLKSEEVYLDHAFRFKEKGLEDIFSLASLSSGMKRTLFHLARLALWPDGTVILIDEFENSLGANCINVVADALMKVGNRLQFVISSHHPYIINKISVDHWKIVARDKGEVQFFSAEQLKIGRSKHKAFTELINNKIFQNGQIPT